MALGFSKLIQHGQYSATWQGTWTEVGSEPKDVAIKLVKKGSRDVLLNADFFLRYLQEDAKASLYITRRIDIKKDSRNQFALVTELMGMNLKEFVEKTEKGLSLEMTDRITRAITQALHFISQAGVVYPNLEITSIFMYENSVKLGGFDQAYFKDAPIIPKPVIKEHYSPPSLLLGSRFSQYSTLWALAMIANYMFTKYLCTLKKTEELLALFPRLLEIS